jgi:hypothetical protein
MKSAFQTVDLEGTVNFITAAKAAGVNWAGALSSGVETLLTRTCVHAFSLLQRCGVEVPEDEALHVLLTAQVPLEDGSGSCRPLWDQK